MRTITCLPLRVLVTRTFWPKRNVRCRGGELSGIENFAAGGAPPREFLAIIACLAGGENASAAVVRLCQYWQRKGGHEEEGH